MSPMTTRKLCGLTLTVALLALACSAEAADPSADIPFAGGRLLGSGPDRLLLGAGAFSIIRNKHSGDSPTPEGRVEYLVGRKWYSFGPLVGIMANTDGGVYGYGGVYTNLAFGHWLITPSVGLGGYARNDSKNLGGVFEFYASLETGYEFTGGSRLGLRFAHISNAGTHGYNPGVESALVTYSIPFE
jgi:lipid A 3-O-deacylase